MKLHFAIFTPLILLALLPASSFGQDTNDLIKKAADESVANQSVDPAQLQKFEAFCDAIYNGGLGPEVEKALALLSEQRSKDVEALQKKLQKKGFTKTFRNEEIIKSRITEYPNALQHSEIRNQCGIGFCWLYSPLSTVETDAREMGLLRGRITLSRLFLGQYHLAKQEDQIFTRLIYGDAMPPLSPKYRYAEALSIAQGGYYQAFAELFKEYGAVPESIMPETAAINDPSWLMAALNARTAKYVEKILMAKQAGASEQELLAIRFEANQEVRFVLNSFFGKPKLSKTKGTFRVKVENLDPEWVRQNAHGQKSVEFTPKSFASYLQYNPDDYVVVGSYAMQPFGKYYVVPAVFDPSQTAYFDQAFLNLPNERLLELAKRAIDQRKAVPIATDVSSDMDSKSGIIHPAIFDDSPLYGLKPDYEKRYLSAAARNYFHVRNAEHEMKWSGYVPAKDGGTQFLTENSWGDKVGRNGFYDYFSVAAPLDLFEVTVPKSTLSPSERKLIEGQPTILTPDNPVSKNKP